MSDRGASIRIPWQVDKDGKGYLEDRRPNANMDPYIVTRLIVDTVCTAIDERRSRTAGAGRRLGDPAPPAIQRARPDRLWR